ncbi:MAG TPA: carbohydrate kinase family protein [Brevefilum fermentans]|jgi:sugar/nucleoside kinase (ribokinase family)|nr:carbohydrate kinase family protein [Brevefilum fermentans]
MKILGLGTVAMDVLMEVDQLPVADSFGVISKVSYLPGGSGTNVIVQTARLGAEASYIAKLGDDSIGKDILTSLEDEGVDIAGMRIKPEGISLHTNVVLDKDGQKFILLNFGDAFGTLSTEDVDRELIERCDTFFTDCFPNEAPFFALEFAKSLGKTTVFNMQTGFGTYAAFGIQKADLLEALSQIDIFAPSREGLKDLFGSEDPQQVLPELRKYFSGTIIVTLGAKGVIAIDSEDRVIAVPAVKIDPVDTTGAGDSFIGTFMVAYLQWNQPLDEALRTANASAAYTCLGIGARSSPNAKQLGEWILTHTKGE